MRSWLRTRSTTAPSHAPALDLYLYGTLYHRLLHGHAPLDERVAGDAGIQRPSE